MMRRRVVPTALRAAALAVGLVVANGETGRAQMNIPDSLFLPITLPPVISFGYPPNTIFQPQIHDLARRKDFDALEAMFTQLALDVTSDVRHETRYTDAFHAFRRNEPALLEALDAWVAARRSVNAHVARAHYHFATAWRRRGTDYIANTPDDARRGMREFSEKAMADVAVALQRDSTHLGALEIYIGVSELFGEHENAYRALTRGLAKHRGSFRLNQQFLHMLWPRWGGTERALIEYGDRAAQDAGYNPRLEVLRGAVHENRANDSTLDDNYAGAVRELNKALAYGPERTYLARRGRAYYRLGAYEYAFNDLRTVVIEHSQNEEALEYYGRTLIELARRARPAIRPMILDRAIESLTLAAYLTPGETNASIALAAAKRMAGK